MKPDKVILYLFFFILFLVGNLTFQHYGISYDEFSGRTLGSLNYDYITKNDLAIFRYHDRDYGPVFEIFIVVVEQLTGISNGSTEQMFYFRHYLIFLTFVLGVIFLYLLCRTTFNSYRWALLGCLILIICPRIYAHAFFNSKDIPFMTFMIISAYSGLLFLRTPSLVNAFVHAFFCALAVDTRMGGVLMPAITVIMFGLQTMVVSQYRSWKSFSMIVCYSLFVCMLVVLMWPMLWAHPLENFLLFFKNSAHFRFPYHEFYMGQWLSPAQHELPWHYLPVWILVSVPIMVSILFIIGMINILYSLRKGLKEVLQHPVIVWALAWFWVPVFVTLITKPTIYDGWRHFYFLYPAMIILAIYGLQSLFTYKKIIGNIVLSLLILELFSTSVKMIRLHPYQHAFFNQLAGKNLQTHLNKFELNLWGVEFRKPLEYIFDNDPRLVIKVFSTNVFASLNLLLIPIDQKGRVRFINDPEMADYWILDYYSMRADQKKLAAPYLLFMLNIEGVDVVGVYQPNRFFKLERSVF